MMFIRIKVYALMFLSANVKIISLPYRFIKYTGLALQNPRNPVQYSRAMS